MAIDLRSDFVGRPTPEMRSAIALAAEKPGAFGLREDPLQRRLEELAAELLGKEDALFLPTCTMCNQTAIHVFCSPGEAFAAEAQSHCILSEGGGPAALSGATAKGLAGKNGFVDPLVLEGALGEGDELRPRTSLVVLENTHNWSGGSVLTLAQMKEVSRVARSHGVPVHLDGARLFNAAVYLGVPASELAAQADSAAISLNKGLSAPLGAVLAGSREFIARAMRVRQRFGGGWRPAGILAAAGIVALETMIERLAEDHVHARKLAQGIAECPGISLDLASVQTNIVMVEINHPVKSIDRIIDALARRDILVLRFGPKRIRLVTYWEIGQEQVKAVVQAFRDILGKD
jgi:threonine aldolase